MRVDPYVNQRNSNHELVHQVVTRHSDDVQEERAWQMGAVLKLIHIHTTELDLNHRQMFSLSPYQA